MSRPEVSKPAAVLLANGLLQTPYAKTTWGLLRGPSRYRILGVVDPTSGGRDAGELLDGRRREIAVFPTFADAIETLEEMPDVCVVGVATVGGILPPAIRADLIQAANLGVTLVNGMHYLLGGDPELAKACRSSGAEIIDIRRPKSIDQLSFWSGAVLGLKSTRVAVLGTDCAVGKRTTAILLWKACRQAGVSTEMIYTGQTGWLQGFEHGFVLDATPNDFVCGEIEQALVSCQQQMDPDLIFIEGQSALRNPAGPCGSEFILGGAVAGVILQHVPGREYFEGFEDRKLRIPPLDDEIALIRSLGVSVWAVTVNPEGLSADAFAPIKAHLRERLSMPVVDPLTDGVDEIVTTILARMETRT